MNQELNLNELEQVSGGNDGMGSYSKTAANYTIKAGDTLYAIAKKYNTTVKNIFDANSKVIIAEANKHGVKCAKTDDYANYIYPGTVLVIPR